MTTNDAASADILRAYIAPDSAAEGDDSTNLFQNPADTALLTEEGFKLDITELHNLADTRRYEVRTYMLTDIYTYGYRLRPREALLSLKWSF